MGYFKTWCLDNFPFMEDDLKALDNYHMMCKLYEYIKNIAGDVAKISEEYTTLMESFTELKNYVDTYLADLDDVKAELVVINNTLDIQASRIDTNASRIEQLQTLVNNNFDILKDYIDDQVEILNYKIDNIQIGQIEIYDPITGLVEPLQTVINNLYNLTNRDGLTATEFDALQLTASGFDAYQITASEFDSQGKTILV
jgi:uncharacterized phage infection (PIP) family protein YhgE